MIHHSRGQADDCIASKVNRMAEIVRVFDEGMDEFLSPSDYYYLAFDARALLECLAEADHILLPDYPVVD